MLKRPAMYGVSSTRHMIYRHVKLNTREKRVGLLRMVCFCGITGLRGIGNRRQIMSRNILAFENRHGIDRPTNRGNACGEITAAAISSRRW